MIRLVLSLLLLGLVAVAGAARAHDPGMTAATIVVDARQTTVEISVKGADLAVAAGLDLLDAVGLVDAKRLAAAGAAIGDHLRAVTEIAAPGASCPLTVDTLAAGGDGILAVLRAPCGDATAGLVYRTRLLHGSRPGTMQTVLLLRGDDAVPVALDRQSDTVALGDPLPPLAVFTRYVVSGAGHIFIGFDHLAFLLALLLWAQRLGTVVKVVTAFTLAHTVTLSLAALELVTPPGSLIEPLIALTIIAVAAENFFNRNVGGRWKTAFALGLIHGFGFAGALTAYGLPRDALVVALASFNIGVEIGQVAVVAVMLPALLLLDRLVVARVETTVKTGGAAAAATARTRDPRLVYGLSAPIALLGLYWLVERTLLS